jgi:hypothetical protein
MSNKHYRIAVAINFFGLICLFNVNSYWADQNNANVFLKVLGALLISTSVFWIVYSYLKQR